MRKLCGRFLALLGLFGLVAGCSLLPVPAGESSAPSELLADWPDQAPSQQQFLDAWLADEQNQDLQTAAEYLAWVARFYRGYNLIPGWANISDRVIAEVPGEEREQVSARMRVLGAELSGEWAKDNSLRRINTRMIAVWRDAFTEAMGQDEVLDFLARLEGDVQLLLGGSLESEAIAYERYYEEDFFF